MHGNLRGWLKVRPAASYAGVKERTFRSWFKSGLRHSRLPSGTVLVSIRAIDEYLEKFEVAENRVDAIVNDVMREVL
jgi:hypothetical protein